MPGVDGLEAARHLAAFDPRPAVVFCTAYDEHALSAFEAAAIDYLMKTGARRTPGRGAGACTHIHGRPWNACADAGQWQPPHPPVRAPARQPAADTHR